MSFLTGLKFVSDAVGVATQIYGSVQQSESLEKQAGRIEDLSVEERAFIRRQAELEADLIEQQGVEEAEVMRFNQAVARDNAAWEVMAGEVALRQAEKRWEAHVKQMVANFAASGAALTGTTNGVILEQIGEMEEDLYLIGLNAERAASQQKQREELFGIQIEQTEARTRRLSAARRETGELEAQAVGTAASARASAARTGARTAQIAGLGNLFASTSSVLSDNADYLDSIFGD